jgi:hypothetical protein
MIDSSWNKPMATKTGAFCAMLMAGVAVCATTQMVQVAASVGLGWVWVDSTAAVQNIRDRQSHADKRTQDRMSFPALGFRLDSAYNGYPQYRNAGQVTIDEGRGRVPTALEFQRSNLARSAMAEPTYEELKAKLAQLEKEVEVKKRSGDLIFKVGEKGGVSVYGLGRFPVTLYYEQWNRLLNAAEDIRKFMEENKSRLKLKDQG